MKKQAAFKFFIGCIAIVFTSCTRDDYEKLLREEQINKDFAKNPPVAQDITTTKNRTSQPVSS